MNRMRGQRWGWDVVVGVTMALLSTAHAAEPDEVRLSRIRAALVEAAVQSRTQVRSVSWFDAQGALREHNRFSSEIRLRDVRAADQPVRDAQPRAVAQLLAQAEPIPATTCAAPAARSWLRPTMGLSATLSPGLTAVQRYPAQLVGQAALAALRSAPAQHWRSAPAIDYARAYDQRLSSAGQEHVQWWIQLLVEGLSGSDQVQDAPALVLRWQVWQRAQPQPWLELRHDVPPARVIVNAATPRTDAFVRQAIAQSAQALAAELDRRLSCDPQPVRVQFDDNRWTLPAGDLAGVRVGDRILLADARALPQHALEPGALDAAVLAEVKSVSLFSAELQPVAGPKRSPQSGWVAWPYLY